MRAVKFSLCIALALLCSGCLALSIHPLYTDEDVLFEPALIGTWSEDKDGGTWAFEPLKENVYRLIITDDGESSNFVAHLLRLADQTFLDLFPEEMEHGNGWYQFHFLSVHTFFQLSLEGDKLELAFLDPKWLKEKSKAGELKLRHQFRDDQIILTASTQELQKFVLAHVEEAFDKEDIGVMSRLKEDNPRRRTVEDGE